MQQWLYDWLGQGFVAIPLLIISVASEIWEWIARFRLKTESQVSQLCKACELTSLGAGTSSILLLTLPLLITNTIPGLRLSGPEWILDVWIYVGAGVSGLTLLVSTFGRRRLRIQGIVVGVIMLALWWETSGALQFARAYAELGPF